ncbi:MAG: type II toxin-antitoxin system RelE/ParE family toxin [Sphingobacteriaceae bacterium]|nr:MAG: type II toxin-antitoxin system RelE/ParE family toxin [Sphingobacteriaceae bacterium]
MNYSLRIREEASAEFTEAYVWYEEKQDNLGERFLNELQKKLQYILKSPHHYQTIHNEFRHAVIERFPFVIIFQIDEEFKEVLLIAIFHTSRNPKQKFPDEF